MRAWADRHADLVWAVVLLGALVGAVALARGL